MLDLMGNPQLAVSEWQKTEGENAWIHLRDVFARENHHKWPVNFTDIYFNEKPFAGVLDVNIFPDDEGDDDLNSRRLVSVGAGVPGKRLHEAIKAMAKLPEYDCHVFTTTPTCERDEKEYFTKKVEIPPNVTIHYDRPHAEIMQCVSGAQALLFPSALEASGGLVGFEAAAHGVPVIHFHPACKGFLKDTGLGYRIVGNTLNERVNSMVDHVRSLETSPVPPSKRRDIREFLRCRHSDIVKAEEVLSYLTKSTENSVQLTVI